MRLPTIPTMIIVLAAMPLGACHVIAQESALSIQGDLHQRQAGFLRALEAQDIEVVTTFFADDAIAHIANMPSFEGREAVAGLLSNVSRFIESTAYTLLQTRFSEDSTMAHSAGVVTSTFPGDDRPTVYQGKFLLVWEKRDESWKVVVYAISNDHTEPGN